MAAVSKSEDNVDTAPITVEEYNELKNKLENYSAMETELTNTKKNISKVRKAAFVFLPVV